MLNVDFAEKKPFASALTIQNFWRYHSFAKWNNTAREFPSLPIHQLFENQVLKSPDAIAVVFENEEITYRELNTKANQVAHFLKEKSVGKHPNCFVALGLDRSIDMIIGILGTLKAGRAYVPLDPAFPDERLRYMLTDTKTPILLTQKNLVSRWSRLVDTDLGFEIVAVDQLVSESSNSQNNLGHSTATNDLAYVIYTSGTTGKPKGVMIEHASLVNYIFSLHNMFKMNDQDIVLQRVSVTFDASIWELFWPLICGAKAVLCSSAAQKDVRFMIHLMKKHNVNYVEFTPSLLRIFLMDSSVVELNSLKIVFTGGEALDQSVVDTFYETCPGKKLFNTYGPTETTVAVTCVECKPTSPVFIGTPTDNVRFYVFDEDRRLLPEGKVGELYIGGTCLARGYLNSADKTAEKFIYHSFYKGSKPVRLYKTGDLVTYNATNGFQYIGRVDNQVKIRGFRVEIEELEEKLKENPSVLHAAVTLRVVEAEKRLIAYVVRKNVNLCDETTFLHELKQGLLKSLPEYIVPSAIILIDDMPLNSSGKIDRKALDSLDVVINTSMVNHFSLPITSTQIILARFWSEILLDVELSSIGLNDCFHDLGGHSLSVMHLLIKIRDHFGISLSNSYDFVHLTLKSMSDMIDHSLENLDLPEILHHLDQSSYFLDGGKKYLLSPYQQRLWLEWKKQPDATYYTIPLEYRLSGKWSIDQLNYALNATIIEFDALRTYFQEESGVPYQVVLSNLTSQFDVIHCVDEDDANRMRRKLLSSSIDLFSPAKSRYFLIQYSSQFCIAVMLLSHLLADDYSVGLFLERFSYHYSSKETDAFIAKGIEHFSAYAESRSPSVEKLSSHWLNRLQGASFQVDFMLPTPCPGLEKGHRFYFSFDNTLSEGLKKLSMTHGATLFNTMSALYKLLILKYFSDADVLLGYPVNIRPRTGELNGLFGYFVNIMLLRFPLNPEMTFVDIIQGISSQRRIENHAKDYPVLDLVTQNINKSRNLSRRSFNLFINETTFTSSHFHLENVEVQAIAPNYIHAVTDLGLYYGVEENHIKLAFEYSTFVFRSDFIEKLSSHFIALASSVLAIPNQAIKNLSLYDGSLLPKKMLQQAFAKGCFFRIQESGKKPPLFLIHPSGGSSSIYMPLADYLEDQPIYAINSLLLFGVDPECRDLPSLASFYVELLEQLYQGPCQLGGYSFGGMVALEMAIQMKSKNISVDNLILIDSFPSPTREYQHDEMEINFQKSIKNISDEKLIASIKKAFFYHYELFLNYAPEAYLGNILLLCPESREKDLWESYRHSRFYEIKIPGDHYELFDKEYIHSTLSGVKKIIEITKQAGVNTMISHLNKSSSTFYGSMGSEAPPILENLMENGILIITFNEAKHHNPFNERRELALISALKRADNNPDVKVVIMTGGENISFSAGGDFREVKSFTGGEEVDRWIDHIIDLYKAPLLLSKPVIAAIDGHAIGMGFQFAMMSDWRIGTPNTKLMMPELKNKLSCTLGTAILNALLGPFHTQNIVFSCEPVSVEKAHNLGLLHQIVPSESLLAAAKAQAEKMMNYPLGAFEKTKKVLNQPLFDALEFGAMPTKEACREAFGTGGPQGFMRAVVKSSDTNETLTQSCNYSLK